MKTRTVTIIVYILVIVGVLLAFFLLGRSAFIAGGRAACHSIDMVLVDGFVCEPDIIRNPIDPNKIDGWVEDIEWDYTP